MRTRKTGNWNEARKATATVGKVMSISRLETLEKFAAHAKKLAKDHIAKQDLNWAAHSPRTTANRARRGLGDKKLFATGDYLKSIDSWISKDTAYAGVKSGEMHKDSGLLLSTIARTMEYGSPSSNIPARELWFPTAWETMAWIKKHHNPVEKAVKRL